MSIRGFVVSQFERPRGLLGRLVGWILARRGSNLLRTGGPSTSSIQRAVSGCLRSDAVLASRSSFACRA